MITVSEIARILKEDFEVYFHFQIFRKLEHKALKSEIVSVGFEEVLV